MAGLGAIGGMVGWYGGIVVVVGRLDRSKDRSAMMRLLDGASAARLTAVGRMAERSAAMKSLAGTAVTGLAAVGRMDGWGAIVGMVGLAGGGNGVAGSRVVGLAATGLAADGWGGRRFGLELGMAIFGEGAEW